MKTLYVRWLAVGLVIFTFFNLPLLFGEDIPEGYILMKEEERIFVKFNRLIKVKLGSILGVYRKGEMIAEIEVVDIISYEEEPVRIVVETKIFKQEKEEKISENDKVVMINYEGKKKGWKEKGFLEGITVEREEITPEKEVLGIELPYDSDIEISGRKIIKLKYGYLKYLEEAAEGTPSSEIPEGVDIEQELQVRARGHIGEKITANIDYDDTSGKKKKVSVVYKGKEEEIIQEAAFGDINLVLPETKYVIYNKSLFGAKVKAQLGRFNLLALGTRTKGETKTKVFSGKTSFRKKDILDIKYKKRKYYLINVNLDFDVYDIVQNSEKIYIDDKNAANNSRSTLQTPEGDFDLQYPGEDYILDYDKGIISFRNVLGSNYVLRVDYQYKDAYGNGGSVTGKIIKHEVVTAEDETYELKNYYYLGEKEIERESFLLQILDANKNEIDLTDFPYEIDYDFGILKFKERKPFPEEVYALSPQHIYTIHVEYYTKVKTYIIQPNMVPESEIVKLNGQILKRDVDYVIDYDSGYITFLINEKMDEETKITIDYEYASFGLEGKQNLFGLRGEANLSDNFKIGTTYLYSGSPQEESPQIGREPQNQQIVDLDTQYILPLNSLSITTSGEMAHSVINPNTSDKGIIDDMESVKVESSIPLESDYWIKSSSPPGLSLLNRGMLKVEDTEIYAQEINSHLSAKEKRLILVLDYDLPTVDAWDSVCYPISTAGSDYSERRYLEFWVYGDGNGEELNIDLGIINEDTDNDGYLDTEDKNGDGKLNEGEDVGYDSGGEMIGAGNGRLDTEDLDKDGYLDRSNNYYQYSLIVNWQGWKRFSIPLKGDDLTEVSKTSVGFPDWALIKHIRIWLKGSSVQGRIKIDSLKIVGNTWEEGEVQSSVDKFTVKHINNQDNPDVYVPYKGIKTNKTEQALALIYDLSAGKKGYTEHTYTKAKSYLDYRYLNFYIYGDNKGETFFMQLGSDEKNYFEYTVLIDWSGWKKCEGISLQNLNKIGSPSLSNIKKLKLGIIGNGNSGEVWVNNIYLDGVIKKEGWAKRLEIKAEIPEIWVFNSAYEKIESDFETLGKPKLGQEISSYNVSSKFNKWKRLPLWGDWEKKEVITSLLKETELIGKEEEGKVTRENSVFGLSLLPELYPQLTFEYKKNKTDFEKISTIQDKDTYFYAFNWPTSLESFILPQDIDLRYKKINKEIIYAALAKSEREVTKDWFGSFLFKSDGFFSLRPTYKLRETKEMEKEEKLKSKNQTVMLQSNLNINKWFSPSFDYEGKYFENITSFPQKNVTTRSSLKLQLPLKTPFPSFTINTKCRFDKESFYENIEEDLDFIYQLGWKSKEDLEKGKLKMVSERENFDLKGRWFPLEWINASCRYNFDEIVKSTTGTEAKRKATTWPDLDFTFKDISFFEKPSFLIVRYLRKEIIKENISTILVQNPSLKWRIDWNAKLLFLLGIEYSEKEEKEGGILRKDSTFSPRLKADYTIKMAEEEQNKIRLISEIRGDFTQNKNYPEKDKIDKYTFSLDGEYSLHRNTEITLGLKYINFVDHTEPIKSYQGYEGSLKFVFHF